MESFVFVGIFSWNPCPPRFDGLQSKFGTAVAKDILFFCSTSGFFSFFFSCR